MLEERFDFHSVLIKTIIYREKINFHTKFFGRQDKETTRSSLGLLQVGGSEPQGRVDK